MKKQFVITLTLLINLIFAQPVTIWSNFFGGSIDSYGRSVLQTTDGGYIIVGEIYSSSDNSYDVWLIKTDSSGHEEWSKTYGGTNSDFGYHVQQTTDGGYVITGPTYSFGNGTYYDILLIKTDSFGNQEWIKNFGGNSWDESFHLYQTSDNGYVIVGYKTLPGSVGENVWLIKTDSSGNILWDKTYGGDGHDKGKSLCQTTDDGYIIVGSKTTSTITWSSYGWLIKTDSFGDTLWTKTFSDDAEASSFNSVKQTIDGGYIIAGSIYENNNQNIWLIKTDSNGKTLWTRNFGNTNYDDYGYDVIQTCDKYILAGTTTTTSAGLWDGILICVDSEGNDLWNQHYNYNSEDAIYSIVLDNDYGLIMTGYSWSGNHKALLIKTSPVYYPLMINEIMQNPDVVDDSFGEWFELFNYGKIAFNVSGWIIKDNDSDSLILSEESFTEGITYLMPGEYFVLGVNSDTLTNGGIQIDYVYSRDNFNLGNSDDEIIIIDQFNNEVDRVEYDGGTEFPDPLGKSMELIYYRLNNKDGNNWKESSSLMPSGDYGTPHSANSTLIPNVIIPFLDEIPDSCICFENTLIYDTSKVAIVVQNSGYGDLIIRNISTGENGSGFKVTMDSIIHAQENGSLFILFTPDTAGFYNTEIKIETNDTNYKTISFDVKGLGLSPVREIYLSADSIDFYEVGIGDSSIFTFTVYNIGATTLEIDNMFTNNPFNVDIFDASIDAGKQLSFEVKFVPQEVGFYCDTLSIISNDSDENNVRIKLTGTAFILSLDDFSIPIEFGLHQNYPNPFNSVTTVSYQLPKASMVNISVYSLNGNLVQVLTDDNKNSGFYSTKWDANNIGSGLYFIRINAGDFSETKKCLLLK